MSFRFRTFIAALIFTEKGEAYLLENYPWLREDNGDAAATTSGATTRICCLFSHLVAMFKSQCVCPSSCFSSLQFYPAHETFLTKKHGKILTYTPRSRKCCQHPTVSRKSGIIFLVIIFCCHCCCHDIQSMQPETKITMH